MPLPPPELLSPNDPNWREKWEAQKLAMFTRRRRIALLTMALWILTAAALFILGNILRGAHA